VAEYSDQVKAQALAALLTGQSFSEVSRMLNVPIGTLKSWKQRDVAGLGAPDASSASTKRERIGALLLDYIEEGLTTLREQVRVFRDATWLKQQSASEVAVLHGVIADKQIRLLEALADESDDSAPDAGGVS
jgi:transposase-like protein